MARSLLILLACVCAVALFASVASAKIVKHTFHVGNLTVRPLCQDLVITAVNGRLPGPLIRVHEGDTLVVHVFNESPYNLSIHWHGIFQLLSGWADGPSYVTQCPLLPGKSYTYRFNITGQEGTLWWHAHFSTLRATVYGGLLIRPRHGRSYPFPKPHREFPILLGEWWDTNPVDVENEALRTGAAPALSDAFTINGRPGDLYRCAQKHTYKLKVSQGNTYMLRIINAALNNQFFFKLAGHNLTVVAIDAAYTVPFPTDVVILGPGQTIDVLFKADAAPGRYYMAAQAYASVPLAPFNNSTTTAILQYVDSDSSSGPLMPALPAFNDTPTAHKFLSNLTSLKGGRVPLEIDERMVIAFGLGLNRCNGSNATCQAPLGGKFSASMNNVSFQLPATLSLLQAHFFGVKGIYTEDFPTVPPRAFDYTNQTLHSLGPTATEINPLWSPVAGTRVKRLKYNATVEIVLQNTAIVGIENHPIHLHGYNFFVVGQGFGNFNWTRDGPKFNLVNPQERNTIGVPAGGWAVIRFQANNPGVWIMHCHLDAHLPWGLATAFIVDNGPTESSTLPPPPKDLPRC